MYSVVKIIPKTEYTLDAGTARDIVLAKYVNTAAWVSGVLVIRVHSQPGSSTPTYVVVQNASYSEEEPNTVFSTATNETTQQVTNAGVSLLVKALNTPISDRVRVLLRTPSSGSTVTFTISVDLIGRDA